MMLPRIIPATNRRARSMTRSVIDIPTDDFLPLELRSPRGGGGRGGSKGSSSSSSDSSTSDSSGGSSGSSSGSSGGSSNSTVGSSSPSTSSSPSSITTSSTTSSISSATRYRFLPIWAIIAIAVASFCALLFFCSLIVLYQRERRKGGKLRHGRIWWKAFTVATWLWIPIGVIKCCCCFGRKRHEATMSAIPGGGGGSGAYTKIEGGAAMHNLPGDSNQWFNGAGVAYGAPAPSKYEPFATVGPNGGIDTSYRQQTPVPPPPYTAPPAGAAAEYYAPDPASQPVGFAPPPQHMPGPPAPPYPARPAGAVPYGQAVVFSRGDGA